MSVESGRYYGLDQIATDLWRRLESPTKVSELITNLQADYDGDDETISQDVMGFLAQMLEQGLIEVN